MTSGISFSIKYPQAFANLHGLIICSNSATQLWPLSRQHAPLELTVDPGSQLSPLAKVIRAIRPYCGGPLTIATPRDIAHVVKRHIDEYALLDDDEYRMLVEPHPRGSALTTALAAATIKLNDPHALLLCMPANVFFEEDSRWESTLKRAYSAAMSDHIGIIGSSVPPQYRTANDHGRTPTTHGYDSEDAIPLLGTIRMGAESKEIQDVYQVRSFIARPAPAVAWRAQQNKSLWSTHIYVLKADLVLAELRSAGRQADDPLKQSVQRISDTARFFVSLGDMHWNSKEASELVEALPALSYEESVFESSQKLAAVPTSIEFTDLTTLAGYEHSVKADPKGNRLRGNTITVQTRDTTVLADASKLVVTLGLEDALVIDTPDATFIASKEALSAMPSVIAALRSNNAPEL